MKFWSKIGQRLLKTSIILNTCTILVEPLQGRCRGFDPLNAHHVFLKKIINLHQFSEEKSRNRYSCSFYLILELTKSYLEKLVKNWSKLLNHSELFFKYFNKNKHKKGEL